MYDMLTAFLNWVSAWPAAVFAALAASSLTLSGVLFSDWRNTVRLEKQHDFAAEESKRTRVAGVRKEVYLPAAGILARMQSYLMALPGVAGPVPESPLVDFADLVGKVSLVGEMKTVLLAQELSAAYSLVHVELIMKARDAQDAKLLADLHQGYRINSLREVERIDGEIAKFFESAKSDTSIFDALKRSRDYYQKKLTDEWKEERDALVKVATEINKYVIHALLLLEPLADKSINLLVAVRDELGQPTDAEKIFQVAKESRDRLYEMARASLATIEQENLQLRQT